jgi:hypothetical protein
MYTVIHHTIIVQILGDLHPSFRAELLDGAFVGREMLLCP